MKNPLEFLENVKNGFPYDLVLALTTENVPKKVKAKEIGLDDWITKPFSPGKLLMGIKRVLRLR